LHFGFVSKLIAVFSPLRALLPRHLATSLFTAISSGVGSNCGVPIMPFAKTPKPLPDKMFLTGNISGAIFKYSAMQVSTSIRRIPSMMAIRLYICELFRRILFAFAYPPVEVPAMRSKYSHGRIGPSPPAFFCKAFIILWRI
jgi:hypothetical protein